MRSHEELLAHKEFVAALARRVAGAEHEDVAQDTLLAALESGPRRPENWRGWLAAVVRNRSRMDRRSGARRAARERASGSRRTWTEPVDATVERLELHGQLVAAVLDLREPYRTVVILRYFEELPPARIAERLDCPRRTVTTRLHRALGQLRERFDTRYGQRAYWAPALLAWAESIGRTAAPSTAGLTTGVVTMASKLAIAAGGFVLGAVTTYTVTETMRTDPPRVARRSTPDRSGTAMSRTAPRDAKTRTTDDPAPTRERVGKKEPAREKLAERTHADWIARINGASNQHEIHAVVEDLRALGRRPARDLVLSIYDAIEKTPRWYVLRGLATDDESPYVFDYLRRIVRDGEFQEKNWARRIIQQYALVNLQDHPERFDTWNTRTTGMERDAVIEDGAAEFARRLQAADAAAIDKEFDVFRRPPRHLYGRSDLALVPILRRLAETPIPPDEQGRTGPVMRAQSAAWRWLRKLAGDASFQPDYLKGYIRRFGDKSAGSAPYYALQAATASKAPWLFDELKLLLRAPAGREFAIGTAYGQLGDKRAIPYLIAEIVADPKYKTIYGYGYFGLGKLTGVRYHESHDGDWWLAWWDKNKHELPAAVRTLDPRRLR